MAGSTGIARVNSAKNALRTGPSVEPADGPVGSHGERAALAGPDADGVVDRQDEDLAVADPPGGRRLANPVRQPRAALVVDQDLDLHLREEVHDVLGVPVELAVTVLPPEAAHVGDRHPVDAFPREDLLHVVELEGLDDRFDLLHARLLPG